MKREIGHHFRGRRCAQIVRIPRRALLQGGLAGLAALMSKSVFIGCSSDDSSSGGAGGKDSGPPLTSNLASVGELGAPDANGVRLPSGFTSRVIARTGEIVGSSSYEWHVAPDGGATYSKPDGGYVYVSNCEFPIAGGAGAISFDADGNIVDAYRILENTNLNCAGGKTPWDTWLSCEEAGKGRVFECDPFGKEPAVARPALGVFKHEAAVVDPESQQLYLSEDEGEGCFYRFTPDDLKDDGFADLDAGKLEVAQVATDGKVTWHELSDPEFTGSTPTREQVAEATKFDGGEGLAYHGGVIYMATKGDNRVWAYDIEAETMTVHYDAATATNPILTGVDNLTVTCCGDVLVAEDGGDMQVVAILADGSIKPLLQIAGHEGSEVTGIAFDPSGTRLYFSSQRGVGGSGGGMTFEVSGPFHLTG